MTTGRLEAFSDGVMAIILTIMVLELDVPKGDDLKSLLSFIPKILNYVLSFVFVGIYWNNHHHLFHAIQKINGKVLWSNLLLLFWLSLLPISTSWMSEHSHSEWPVAFYGFILFMSSISFVLIESASLKIKNQSQEIIASLKNKRKEKITLLAYIVGIGLAFVNPIISLLIYTLTAILWIIPDKRIEKILN